MALDPRKLASGHILGFHDWRDLYQAVVDLVHGPAGGDGINGKTVRNGSGAPSGSLGVDGDFYLDTTAHAIYGPRSGGAWGSPTGLVGPTGPAGADGKTLRNGVGTPSSGLGVDGDFYLNTASSGLYGPKAGGSWGAPVSLVGPAGSAGAAGADGKTVRSGSGAPSGGLGVDGDFYVDVVAHAIYGPRSSGAWGSPTGLAGPQGPAGSGGGGGGGANTVLNGTTAPSDAAGADGDFYLDTVASRLYGPKASGTWGSSFTSLVGPQGPQGVQGVQGNQGIQGPGGNTVLNGQGAPSSGTGVNGDFYLDTTASRLYGPKASGFWGSSVPLVGPTGATGSTGATGAAGSTVRNGSGVPSSGLGADGDFYVDTAAGRLYGPKSSGAWGSGASLVGPTGSAGADGKTVRSGLAVPSGGLGVDGDFYINTAANTVYGPKSSGSWGSPTSLVGATGATGATGAAGADGKTVRNGTSAPSFGLGVDGDFYVDTTASRLYGPKASGAWGSGVSLVGATGSAGTDGKTLRSGAGVPSSGLGVDGDFYVNTSANTLYGPKASGAWGSATSLVGPTGSTGAAGVTGSAGADGKTVRSGSGVPSSGLGVDGDFYVNTSANTIYGPKAGGAWGSPTSLVGPTGSTGAAGNAVRSGSGAPSSGLGVDGDFYVNTAANTIYGPKTSGAWGSATSLVGPTGSTGSAGTAGNTVLNGTGAPSSGIGVNGDFYLNTTNTTLYGPKAAGAWPGSGVALSLTVGTTTGTVAAGNDSRITGAAQKASNGSDFADIPTVRVNLGLPAVREPDVSNLVATGGGGTGNLTLAAAANRPGIESWPLALNAAGACWVPYSIRDRAGGLFERGYGRITPSTRTLVRSILLLSGSGAGSVAVRGGGTAPTAQNIPVGAEVYFTLLTDEAALFNTFTSGDSGTGQFPAHLSGMQSLPVVANQEYQVPLFWRGGLMSNLTVYCSSAVASSNVKWAINEASPGNNGWAAATLVDGNATPFSTATTGSKTATIGRFFAPQQLWIRLIPSHAINLQQSVTANPVAQGTYGTQPYGCYTASGSYSTGLPDPSGSPSLGSVASPIPYFNVL